MSLVHDPVELATATTDGILAIVAAACTIWLLAASARDAAKGRLWAAAFALLTLASALGFVQHGLQVSAATRLWAVRGVGLTLGLTIALFVVGAVRDRWGARAGWRALPAMLAVGLAFSGIAFAFPTTFLPVILYEATAMVFALGVYISLVLAQRPGAAAMTAGILVTIVAAVVQVSPAAVDVGWRLDHNSLFHLIQNVGVALLMAGLITSLSGAGAPTPRLQGEIQGENDAGRAQGGSAHVGRMRGSYTDRPRAGR